jgi:hypothetical protein
MDSFPTLRSTMAACPTGGKFAIHIDFNQHFVAKLDARLVFVLLRRGA